MLCNMEPRYSICSLNARIHTVADLHDSTAHILLQWVKAAVQMSMLGCQADELPGISRHIQDQSHHDCPGSVIIWPALVALTAGCEAVPGAADFASSLMVPSPPPGMLEVLSDHDFFYIPWPHFQLPTLSASKTSQNGVPSCQN